MKSYQPPPKVDEAGVCIVCGEGVTQFGGLGWICDANCAWYQEADRQEAEAMRLEQEARQPDLNTLLGRLQAVELAAKVFVGSDGHPSIGVRSNEEAAALAHQVMVEWYNEHPLDGERDGPGAGSFKAEHSHEVPEH